MACMYCHSNQHTSGEHRSGIDPNPEAIITLWPGIHGMDVIDEARLATRGRLSGRGVRIGGADGFQQDDD